MQGVGGALVGGIGGGPPIKKPGKFFIFFIFFYSVQGIGGAPVGRGYRGGPPIKKMGYLKKKKKNLCKG